MRATKPFTRMTRYRTDPSGEAIGPWTAQCLAPGCPRQTRNQGHGLCATCWRAERRRARAILEAAGFDVRDEQGKRRPFCHHRMALMAVLRGATRLSLHAIGRLFNRDHATVVYAERACRKRCHPARTRFQALWAAFDDMGLLRRDKPTAETKVSA